MKIQDYITETKKVAWENLHDLQPENLKVKMHGEKTKQSIIDLGFARAIYVWQEPETNITYIIDGHCRKDILYELTSEGYDIPKELSCTFLDNKKIKNKREAIIYLVRVFNIKTDPINEEIFEDMLEDLDLSLDDICSEDLNIMFEEEGGDRGFTPNVNPVSSSALITGITDDDVDKVLNITKDVNTKDKQEVMCPHCYNKFYFNHDK
jgi:hypothetical protein